MDHKDLKDIVVLKCGVPTPSGYVYTEEAIQKAIAVFNERLEKKGVLYGELAYKKLNRSKPVEPQDIAVIEEKHVSHKFENLRIVDHQFTVDITVLDTPSGKAVQTHILALNNEPVFGLRCLLPMGVFPENITELIPVAIDFVDAKKKTTTQKVVR